MKPSIIKTEQIFKMRTFLQNISHISFSFSKINQRYPIDTLSDKQCDDLIKVYKQLLKDAEDIVNSYKKFNLNNENENSKSST